MAELRVQIADVNIWKQALANVMRHSGAKKGN